MNPAVVQEPPPVKGRDWTPNPGPQLAFLRCPADEVLYGGAAGGGKSDALLASALRMIGHQSYRGIIFRRTFPELEGSLIDRSQLMYSSCGGVYNGKNHSWKFPSGAKIYFSHLQHEDTVYNHKSSEYQWIGFDELTSFTENQYRYMFSRLRSSRGLPVRMRAATNPGGEGHDWVFKRWGAFLDPKSPTKIEPGKIQWFLRKEKNGEFKDYDCEPHTPKALTRTFIPAKLEDTPQIDEDYEKSLSQLNAVDRARLRHGDWLAKEAGGTLFKRHWYQIVDYAPRDAFTVRYWDRAATEAVDGKDPDWTVGARWSRTAGGVFYVEHVCRFRGRPLQVEQEIRRCAEADGRGVEVVLEQDPGQAGVTDIDHLVRVLAGFTVRPIRPTGDKITRAKPHSAQAERGFVKIVRGDWNADWLREHEEFPDGNHDDQVDTSSGALEYLADNVPCTFEDFDSPNRRM